MPPVTSPPPTDCAPAHGPISFEAIGIENRNHDVRDVSCNEDRSRIRDNPGIMARARSFALNIISHNGKRRPGTLERRSQPRSHPRLQGYLIGVEQPWIDRRGGRAPALADLERQGQECPAHTRADPQGHARLQGRARSSHDGRGIPQAAARVARGRQLSPRPERPARQLRRMSPRRLTRCNFGDQGTANLLINRRMNKAQQMRWSRRGADLLLQVRCAIYNGSLGSGFGHLFERVSTSGLPLAKAA